MCTGNEHVSPCGAGKECRFPPESGGGYSACGRCVDTGSQPSWPNYVSHASCNLQCNDDIKVVTNLGDSASSGTGYWVDNVNCDYHAPTAAHVIAQNITNIPDDPDPRFVHQKVRTHTISRKNNGPPISAPYPGEIVSVFLEQEASYGDGGWDTSINWGYPANPYGGHGTVRIGGSTQIAQSPNCDGSNNYSYKISETFEVSGSSCKYKHYRKRWYYKYTGRNGAKCLTLISSIGSAIGGWPTWATTEAQSQGYGNCH